MVAGHEDARLAQRLIDATCLTQGIGPHQLTIRADRGAPPTVWPPADFPAATWTSIRTTTTIETLNRAFRRRTTTQAAFGTDDAALTVLDGLIAFGQLQLRKTDGHTQAAGGRREAVVERRVRTSSVNRSAAGYAIRQFPQDSGRIHRRSAGARAAGTRPLAAECPAAPVAEAGHAAIKGETISSSKIAESCLPNLRTTTPFGDQTASGFSHLRSGNFAKSPSVD